MKHWIKIVHINLLLSFVLLNITGYGQSPKIDTLFDIRLNGLEQKISIQSNDLNNPILLWLHGGPGTSEMFINHHCMNNLPRFYTIVHWDQRGTALSFNHRIKSADISFDMIFNDAIKLTDLLIEEFHQEKIFLIGHSFGSILGIHLIEKYPDRFYAYVGIGQVIHYSKSIDITYKWLINKLYEENYKQELSRINSKQDIPMDLIDRYKGNFCKEHTLLDVIKESPYYFEGYLDIYTESMNFVRESIRNNPSSIEKNILNDILTLQIPVYFFEGRHDRIPACAPELVIEYMKKVKAPKKEIIWFEESAHHPNIDEPEKFQYLLIEKFVK